MTKVSVKRTVFSQSKRVSKAPVAELCKVQRNTHCYDTSRFEIVKDSPKSISCFDSRQIGFVFIELEELTHRRLAFAI